MAGYGIPTTRVNNAEAFFQIDPATGSPVALPASSPVVLPTAAVYTFTATANGDMIGVPASIIDVSDYAELIVNVTSVGGGCTVTFYESETSGGTYTAVPGISVSNSPVVFTTTTTTQQYKIYPNKAWFKLTVSGYTSGTPTVIVTCRGFAAINPVQAVTGAALEGGSIRSPVQIGVEARTTSKTSVSNNQVVLPIGTVDGRPVQLPFSIPENSWSYAAAGSGIVNTTTAVTVKTAAGAGVRNYVTRLQLATDTLGGATEFAIRDGAAGTVLWRGKLQTGPLAQSAVTFNPPLRGTANTLVEIVTLTAVTGGVYANLQGFVGP